MGANQSSKSQVSIDKQRNTNSFQHQQQQVASGKKLSSSLRKSVGNVLTSSRLSTSSEKSSSNNNKCKKNNKEILSDRPQQVGATCGTDTVDYNLDGANLMLSSQCQQRQQQQVTDSYYVSPIDYGNGFMTKAVQNGGANNYASQSQLMLSASAMDQNKQQQQQLLLSDSIYNKNVPRANFSYHSGQPTREMDSVKTRDGLFIALDHQSSGSNIISRSQKHQLRYNNHQMQQQQHHPSKAITAITTTSQSSPFHLSRAVNTKTSSVLNNNNKNIGGSVATPNAPVGFIASSLTSCGGATAASAATAIPNNGLQSLSVGSPAYQIQHQHHHQSPYAQQYLYSGEPTTAPQYCEDSENQQQYYVKSLLDAPKSQTPGRRRYKCPKQQYQYLNTSSSPSSMPATQQQHLDFHQYFNKQATNFHRQQDHQHQQHQHPTLDCSNYNRSYSFGSARTIENSGKKNKTHNKLMSIFQNNNNNSKQQYSNTIHLGDKKRIQLKQLTASGYSITPNTSNQRSCPGSLKRTKAAPLSAQQASYEAMRTIDMYLIRQIARSCMVSKEKSCTLLWIVREKERKNELIGL